MHPHRNGERIRADDTKSVSDIGRIAMIGGYMRSDQIGFGAHRHVITVGGHSWDPENGHTLLAAVDRASARAPCEVAVHRFAEPGCVWRLDIGQIRISIMIALLCRCV